MIPVFRKIKALSLKMFGLKSRKDVEFPKIKEEVSRNVFINQVVDDEIELTRILFLNDNAALKSHKVKNKTFVKCIFSQSIINNLTFSECSFIDCSFNGAVISNCEFHECYFCNCIFYKSQFFTSYINPKSFCFSHEWHWYWANVNVGLFQALYKNSKDMHQESFAREADKKFNFYKRYVFLRGKKPKLIKFLLNLIYDYALGYGYGAINAIVMTAILLGAFTFMIKDYLKSGNSLLEAFYFATASLTTVGYGDVSPILDTIPMWITIIFLLMSVAWCAVVTAIIVKRIVR